MEREGGGEAGEVRRGEWRVLLPCSPDPSFRGLLFQGEEFSFEQSDMGSLEDPHSKGISREGTETFTPFPSPSFLPSFLDSPLISVLAFPGHRKAWKGSNQHCQASKLLWG